MSLVEVVATHRDLTKTVTIELDRLLLVRATHGQNTMAQRAIALRVRNAYNQAHRKNVRFITWHGLSLKETDASAANTPGCSCECRGCDDNTWHCHKVDRGCEL